MSLIGLAGQCGISSSALKELMNGSVPVGATRLGVTRNSLQEFVDGGTSIGLAGYMGVTASGLQELRNHIGREGAIGLLIGLLSKK